MHNRPYQAFIYTVKDKHQTKDMQQQLSSNISLALHEPLRPIRLGSPTMSPSDAPMLMATGANRDLEGVPSETIMNQKLGARPRVAQLSFKLPSHLGRGIMIDRLEYSQPSTKNTNFIIPIGVMSPRPVTSSCHTTVDEVVLFSSDYCTISSR